MPKILIFLALLAGIALFSMTTTTDWAEAFETVKAALASDAPQSKLIAAIPLEDGELIVLRYGYNRSMVDVLQDDVTTQTIDLAEIPATLSVVIAGRTAWIVIETDIGQVKSYRIDLPASAEPSVLYLPCVVK